MFFVVAIKIGRHLVLMLTYTVNVKRPIWIITISNINGTSLCHKLIIISFIVRLYFVPNPKLHKQQRLTLEEEILFVENHAAQTFLDVKLFKVVVWSARKI